METEQNIQNLNRHISTRKITHHVRGTLYLSLPSGFSSILNEAEFVAYPAEDGKSVVLIPASHAKVTIEAA